MFAKDKDAQISRFRGKHIEKSRCYGIKQDIVRWQVKHTESYIKSHKAPIKTHTCSGFFTFIRMHLRKTCLIF